MQTKDFDYHLPAELIAQEPAPERTQARLMLVDRATGVLGHYHVADLPSLLQSCDLMVVNDTRVIPARMFGRKEKTGGKVEILFIEEYEAHRPGSTSGRGVFAKPSEAKNVISPRPDSVSGQGFRAQEGKKNTWQVFLHASGRIKEGEVILLDEGKAKAVVRSIGERGRFALELQGAGDFAQLLAREGLPPLPPYIKRPKGESYATTPLTAGQACHRQKQFDAERYQTVYARAPGAVAAPTAGLHLSEELLNELEKAGIERTAVTLHVGPGTFIPVRCENIADHRMESERFVIEPLAARNINKAIAEKRRIVAVGTTSVRTLESAVRAGGQIEAGTGRTEIFIYPPFRFQIVGALLTNFHLPKSTLLMLVSAFAGKDLILHAYETAIREKYRFYSYGDCMLII